MPRLLISRTKYYGRLKHTGLTDTSWVATIYVLAMSVFIITVSNSLISTVEIGWQRHIWHLSLVWRLIHYYFLIIFRLFQGIEVLLTPIVLPMGIELQREYQPYYCYYGYL